VASPLEGTDYARLVAAARAVEQRELTELAREIDKRIASAPAALVREANLGQPAIKPPNPIDATTPGEDALSQASELTARVGLPGFERHARRFKSPLHLRPGAAREAGLRTWPVALPGDFDRHAATIGLPLLAAFSPDALDQVLRWRLVAQYRPRIGSHTVNRYRRLVTDAIGVEHAIWQIAAIETGNDGLTMPYAYRFFALGWLWHPDAHEGGFAYTLCIRCGTLLYRNRRPAAHRRRAAARRKLRPAPLCDHCADDSASARQWPTAAVAPAGPGSWWIKCQHPDCPHIYEATRRSRVLPPTPRQQAVKLKAQAPKLEIGQRQAILEHATTTPTRTPSVRARELDESERDALTVVLERIEKAAKAVAAECGADLRVEWDDRGKFSFVAFRLHGLAPTDCERAEAGGDT
jgi:hypothetical protein